tara:strand:+ start:149 stop:409 length:261 start_codon:yes stop_codon:yes gene_type:complete
MAQTIYATLATNKAAEAEIRAEAISLARSIATDANKSFELTSSTVNGQTFSGTRTMSNLDRLQLLGLIVNMYDAGGVLSKNVTPLY